MDRRDEHFSLPSFVLLKCVSEIYLEDKLQLFWKLARGVFVFGVKETRLEEGLWREQNHPGYSDAGSIFLNDQTLCV